MRNLVCVVFVEPVTDGLVFPRTQWPLHITLARFDVEGDAELERLAALVDPHAKAALGARLAVGEEAGFGRNGTVAVNLIQPQRDLQVLHEELVGAVASAGGKVLTPAHTLGGYRPHVSHQGGRQLRPGDAVVLDRIALVDMAPDGDRTVRRVLRLWSLDGAGAGS